MSGRDAEGGEMNLTAWLDGNNLPSELTTCKGTFDVLAKDDEVEIMPLYSAPEWKYRWRWWHRFCGERKVTAVVMLGCDGKALMRAGEVALWPGDVFELSKVKIKFAGGKWTHQGHQFLAEAVAAALRG